MSTDTTERLIFVLAWLAVFLCPAMAEDRTWHLLQRQADGGIAAITHGLTKKECDFSKNRIEGMPATPSERATYEADSDASFKWLFAHPECGGGMAIYPGPGVGEVIGEGVCIWRGPSGRNSGRSFSPHDVMTAECFQ